jgi:hypothetical protein
MRLRNKGGAGALNSIQMIREYTDEWIVEEVAVNARHGPQAEQNVQLYFGRTANSQGSCVAPDSEDS